MIKFAGTALDALYKFQQEPHGLVARTDQKTFSFWS